MNENWDQLELEIETDLAQIGHQLDVNLPADVRERARLTTRIALDEHLLEARGDAAISPVLRDRLRLSVRRELGLKSRSIAKSPGWRRHTQGLGAMASAAMILICVGVIHYAASLSPPHANRLPDPFDNFVRAGMGVYDMDPLAHALETDLRDLEENIVHWSPEGDRIEDGLQQLDEMIDTLQIDSLGENGTL